VEVKVLLLRSRPTGRPNERWVEGLDAAWREFEADRGELDWALRAVE
jgi:hypothetical protein